MGPDNLHRFIEMLDEAGELSRIETTVDPDLEASAIVNRVCKAPDGGRALVFESVSGAGMPLAANLFGSTRRVAMALGIESVEELAERLRRDLSATGQADSVTALAHVLKHQPSSPALVQDPPCFAEDLGDIGLAMLPALRSWPQDGGRYLTLGQVFTSHPETQTNNCGMYRVQVVDGKTALLRCHPGAGGGEHIAAWNERGESAPVAIALGGPPVLTWVAGIPLPGEVDEVAFAGYLQGRPLRMTAGRTSRLLVPADAEIIIEGLVHPDDSRVEGPFGNHTGYYAQAAPAPVLRVTKVWSRRHAICPGTVVGPPPMENIYLAAAAERLLLPLLQYDHPWVKDVHLPAEGIYHRAALVAVDAPGQGLAELCHALWQSALLKNSRLLVLLDHDADVHDYSSTYWRIVNSGEWQRSIMQAGGRLVLDARTAASRARVCSDDKTRDKVLNRWKEYGLDDV